jgi:hypothetical protein
MYISIKFQVEAVIAALVPYFENCCSFTNLQRRAGGVDQVVQCLPSKHEALSSNTNTAKKKKKNWTGGVSFKSTCFARAKSWVQTVVPPKKNKNSIQICRGAMTKIWHLALQLYGYGKYHLLKLLDIMLGFDLAFYPSVWGR